MLPTSRLSVLQKLLLPVLPLAVAVAYLLFRVAAGAPGGLPVVDGAAAVAALALAVMSAGWIARQARTSADGASRMIERLVSGDLGGPVTADAAGHPDGLEAGLLRLQEALRQQAVATRTDASGEGLARAALDKVAVNVMIADVAGKITYMNESVTQMFRTRADEIRKQIPHFDPDKVLGANFDGFHKVKAQQRNMLAQLRGTHSSEMLLGEAALKIVAMPLFAAAGDRLGTLVQWIDRTEEVSTEREVQFVVGAAAKGDLTRRIRTSGKSGFYVTLAEGMNAILESNANIVRDVQHAAREVASSADEIARGNLDLSQRTEHTASSLEETASSMEEMTSTVRQNADNAAQANQLAAAARLQAEKGGAVVSEAVSAMQGINAASNKIADIIGVIDEIAFQTNLLALNAAVEAARAGDQGRGFAVVASEVRGLASRSAAAAKEIKTLIQDSTRRVEQGARLVDQSGATLSEIVASVKKVTDIVSEIAAASSEQASGIDEVNKAVTSMDEVTQNNAALVEQASAATQSLLDQARRLDEKVARCLVGDEDPPAWNGHDRRREEAWLAGKPPAASAAPQPATPAAASPAARPANERRAISRPWSAAGKAPAPLPARAKAKTAQARATDATTPRSRTPAGGGDEEWAEF